MKLSTKSRYGTRLMLEMAHNYDNGVIQLGEIARRQNISVKYLEQIIIPLKKANYVTSIRGAKGGHKLALPPQEISVGSIVSILEGGSYFTDCSDHPDVCDVSDTCPTRRLWAEAADAMFERLNQVSLYDLMEDERKTGRRHVC